ncbi:putative quinol monooxygenase, partial [Natrinema sp. H-ect4]
AHSEVPVKPASRETAMELLETMAVRSRAEAGVIDYRVTVDLEDPNTFRIIEQYEDEAAFESHESSTHLDRFQSEITPCLAEEAELTRFTVTSETALPGP